MKKINQSSVNQSKGFSINASDFAKVLKENNIRIRRKPIQEESKKEGLIPETLCDLVDFLVRGSTIDIANDKDNEKQLVWDKIKLDTNKDSIIELVIKIHPFIDGISKDKFSKKDLICIKTLHALVTAADIQEEEFTLKRKK